MTGPPLVRPPTGTGAEPPDVGVGVGVTGPCGYRGGPPGVTGAVAGMPPGRGPEAANSPATRRGKAANAGGGGPPGPGGGGPRRRSTARAGECPEAGAAG